MTVLQILETLLIGPIKLIFEIIFGIANRFVEHPGLSIIFLSLAMNVLVLPLYKRADAMQEENRVIEAKLRDGVAHIKKTFSGDERMMMLQAYYRQNHYKPTDALNGSVSLLLEVPFFMAAYQFLSNLDLLNGVSLGPIADLGAPDGMLSIGGIAINILPVLMTLINVISSALYLKGFPLKTKIQLYAMAGFFLVFLYTSPAGLVFYWTLNNVFSLVKTIFYKLKNPRKALEILTALAGVGMLVFGFAYRTDSAMRRIFLLGLGGVLLLPMAIGLVKARFPAPDKEKVAPAPNKKLFAAGSLFLTVLVGLLIPSAYIAASPQEYVDITYFYNPNWYVVSATCLAAGAFLVWMGVFYWLASPRGKVIFDKLVWCLCGVMLVNYMFFGTSLGVISSTLQYEGGISFSMTELLINLLVAAVLVTAMCFVPRKWAKTLAGLLTVAALVLGGMSVANMVKTQQSVAEVQPQEQTDSELPHFQLSKTGKNVVVIMLDRAMGEYVPYLFNEKPELKAQFAGFTYYKNTVSFGAFTNFGTAPLFGGYEYTPVEMNKRDTESLKDKHNEALKLMPVLFSQNGYDVTVCDPVYAGYQWVPDLSVFSDYPEIQTYITKGKFSALEPKQLVIDNNRRNFFCFSIMKTMPLFLQDVIYNGGQYHKISSRFTAFDYSGQVTQGMSVANCVNPAFMENYNTLTNLANMTNITQQSVNTYLSLVNDITHEPMLLQVPAYAPAQYVNNSSYDAANTHRFTVDGVELKVENAMQMAHYQTNMAAMLQLGKWFDYLRENGVYDNTRIVLVSDHGRALGQLEQLIADDGSDDYRNVEYYFPLLMVKDFNSSEFSVSDAFMTNADVPTLAMDGVIENPVNPFTGKPVNSQEKTAHDQYVIVSPEYDILLNNGNTYLPARWASVRDSIWNLDNWNFYDEMTVLADHAMPE